MKADYLSEEASRTMRFLLRTLPRISSTDARSHRQEYDSEYLPNTRIDLLAKIIGRCGDPSTRNIFWLCGMAGTGKSTIARTVANNLYILSSLAANFFFSRFEAERNTGARFVSTIAAQIVDSLPATGNSIAKSLETSADICERKLRE